MKKINKTKLLITIQWLYNIFSLLFIFIIVGALIFSENTKNHTTNTEPNINELKTRRNTGYNDQYGNQFYYNSSDFFTYNFLDQMLNYVIGISDTYSGFSISSSVNNLSILWAYNSNGNVSTNLSGNFSYFSGDIYTGIIQVKMIIFSKETWSNFDTPYGVNVNEGHYTLTFYDGTSLNSNVILAVNYIIQSPTPTLNYSELNGGLLYRCWYTSSISDYYISSGIYTENDLDGICLFHDIGLETSSNNTLSYNKGYNDGHRAGYDEGYVKGSQGIETNAFTVMSQAFQSVGDILGINVLPNLPLWVVVFVPLIIAVVIVVVKLIKG